MIENVTWKRSAVAVAAAVVLGLTGCSGSGDSDADDDPSSSDSPTSAESTSTSDSTEDATDEPEGTDDPSSTDTPAREGGWKPLPDCAEFAESIVEDEEIAEGEQVEGKTCRYDVGTDRVIGRQVVWITVHGGDWPTKFKAAKINNLLADAADQGDGKYSSSVKKVKARGWSYGIKFSEKIGDKKRTSYRLFAFAENGDLLSCNTGLAAAELEDFVEWCDTVKDAVSS